MISFPKPRRIVDRKLLDEVKKLPCLICRRPSESDPCHVKSVGSGGSDEIQNCISLCRPHHTEQHKHGWKFMTDQYEVLKQALILRGWRFDDYRGKWIRNRSDT